MKALSHLMWLIITIIIVLVVALVVLTLFGRSVIPVAGFSEAEAYCSTAGSATCAAAKQLPSDWNEPTVQVGSVIRSCAEILPNAKCENGKYS